MPRSSHNFQARESSSTSTSSKRQPPPFPPISAIICSKRGVLLSVTFSFFVYFVIFQWWSSNDRQDPIEQTNQVISVSGSDDLQEKADKPSNSLKNVLDPTGYELENRRKLYEEKCIQRQNGFVSELFLHPPSKLSVCHVPKAGCTFWKRLFRYLNTEHNRANVSSPFDISRVQAHFGPSINLPTYDYLTPEGRLLVDSSTKGNAVSMLALVEAHIIYRPDSRNQTIKERGGERGSGIEDYTTSLGVMMTRSPYRRLWSAYIDKFVLPEWWIDHGKAIMYARKDVQRMKGCPDDISFEEFLEYSIRNHEQHWRPISELCNPCTFKPKFIGHVDRTFMRDVRYILGTLSLDSLLEGYKEDKHLTNDIENLVDYHCQMFQQRLELHQCMTWEQLASTLWRALQMNGYYKTDHAFPQEQIKVALRDVNPKQARDSIIKIFLDEFRPSSTTEQTWLLQREDIIAEAYRNVSSATKQKILHRYYDDFEIFGFDTTAPDEERGE